MSRRDVIILSVLINTGLLAILFVTAWQSDEGVQGAVVTPIAPQVVSTSTPETLIAQNEEIIIPEQKAVLDSTILQEVLVADGNTVTVTSKGESASIAKAESKPQPAYVEVTVKRGDYLGRIASANGVTVDAIMKANHLSSAQLQVGQVLKIPKSTKEKKESATSTASATKEVKSAKDTKIVAMADDGYYTIQKGDNPWSIARKFQISHEDLLKWNQLNEEGARNLQAGQKLRVRK